MINIKSINGKGKRSSNLDFFYKLSENIFIILDGYNSTTEKDIVDFCSKIQLEQYENLENIINIIQYINPSFNSCITLLEIRGETLRYFYLGDIRVYVNSILVTKDHSYAWKLLERTKCFAIEKIASKCVTHKYRNQIYKDLRGIIDNENEIMEVNINLPTEILICTDGYWVLEHEKIIKVKNYSLKKLSSDDNYSAILLSIK